MGGVWERDCQSDRRDRKNDREAAPGNKIDQVQSL
jgi:hypothetical protein